MRSLFDCVIINAKLVKFLLFHKLYGEHIMPFECYDSKRLIILNHNQISSYEKV